MDTVFLIDRSWVLAAYLLAAVLFILGIKGLTHPRTAVRGNLLGALGMLIAAGVTLLARGLDFKIILAGVLVGAAIGAVAAWRVPMTAMPQMVALFNGFGGIASALVAGTAFLQAGSKALDMQMQVATAASALIGAVTFTGSLIAFAKLQELRIVPQGAVQFPGQKLLNLLLALAALAAAVWLVVDPASTQSYWVLVGIAGVFGMFLVLPIGGADMPVVIALLNRSFRDERRDLA